MTRVVILLLFASTVIAQTSKSSGKSSPVAGVPSTETRSEYALHPAAATATTSSDAGGALLHPIRCDKDGNVYFRRYRVQDLLRAAVRGYTPSGELKATYPVLSQGEDYQGGDFFLTKDADLYQIAWKDDGSETLVLKFGKDGGVSAKVKLEAKLFPFAFGVFEDGSFLVGGINPDAPEGVEEAYTGVFSSSGKLVKRVSLEEDKGIADSAKDGNSEYAPASGDGTSRAIARSRVIAASDGNLYLARSTNTVQLHAIGPDGRLKRSVSVKPPRPGIALSNVAESNGRLAVLFRNTGESEEILEIADLQDGTVINNYSVDPALGSFACYADNEVTFVGTKNGKFAFSRLQAP
jgi:hypothetical protein